MPIEYAMAASFMMEVLEYGYVAFGWKTYKQEDLNKFWVQFQKMEKELLNAKNSGQFGSYYYPAQELYYKIANDFRDAMKQSGNL